MSLRAQAIPLLLVIASSLGLSLGAQEEKPPAAGGDDARATERNTSAESRLQALWFERKADLEAGDTAAAAGRIEAITELIRSERLDRVTWLARGFAYEGYEHLREGNYERAREAFDIARRFDNRMPEAQTGYAWAALKAGRGAGQFLTEYRKALQLRWEMFQRNGVPDAFLVAAILCCLAAVIVVGILVLRYQSMLRHDVAERMPRGWPEGATALVGWIVLVGPLLAWLGGVWILYYWCIALARYMTGREKLLASVCCVALIAAGPLAAWGTATAEIASDPTNVAVDAALRGDFGTNVIAALRRAVEANPDALALQLLLANTYDRANLSRDAFDTYHRILQIRHDDPRALNNVGNLYMHTGQTAQAIVYYTRAAEADPASAISFYNLSIAQNEALRLADAETSIRMVQQLDPNLGRALIGARGRGDEISPIPATASGDEIWREVGIRSAASMVRGSVALTSPSVIGAISTIVLIAWFGLFPGGSRAQTCVRCGEAFCGRCKRELGARECCAQCIHLFVKREAIAADVRAQKMMQVERFVRGWRRRVRLATILMPGAGHMLAGSTVTGVLMLIAWLVPLSALGLGRWLVLHPTVPVLDLPAITSLMAASFMTVLWGIANFFIPAPPR
jgi:Tfp pilus assembly protein PilF